MKKSEIIKKMESDINYWEETRRLLKHDSSSNRVHLNYIDGKLSVLNEYLDYLK